MNVAVRQSVNRESGEVRAVIAKPWTAVPEHILEDRRLSLQARCMLAYMLGLARRPNWVIRLKNHVLPTMGVSPERWRSIRKELESLCYYRMVGTRGDDGRMTYAHYITDDPTAPGWANDDPATGVDFPAPGGATPGNAAPGGAGTGNPGTGRPAPGRSGTGAARGGSSEPRRTSGGKPTPLHRTTARSFSGRKSSNSDQELPEQGTAGAAPNPQASGSGELGDETAPPEAPGVDDAAPKPATPPARPSDPRGTRLPDDWAPTDEMLDWAERKRPDVDPGLESEKFVNYWVAIPGGKGRKLDWPATWHNWILGARATPGYAPARPEAAPPSKTLQSLESLNAFSTTYGHAGNPGSDQELQLFAPPDMG